MGYKEFYNDDAFKLILWSLKSKNQVKAFFIKRVADKMEQRYRDYYGKKLANKKPKTLQLAYSILNNYPRK